MAFNVPKLRGIIAAMFFLATTLNYGDRLTLGGLTRGAP